MDKYINIYSATQIFSEVFYEFDCMLYIFNINKPLKIRNKSTKNKKKIRQIYQFDSKNKKNHPIRSGLANY